MSTDGTTVIITLTVPTKDRQEAISEAFAILAESDNPHPVSVSVWADDGSKWGSMVTVSRLQLAQARYALPPWSTKQ